VQSSTAPMHQCWLLKFGVNNEIETQQNMHLDHVRKASYLEENVVRRTSEPPTRSERNSNQISWHNVRRASYACDSGRASRMKTNENGVSHHACWRYRDAVSKFNSGFFSNAGRCGLQLAPESESAPLRASVQLASDRAFLALMNS